MNNDFIKGLSVGIVLLILYVFLQPQTDRYVFHRDHVIILDTKTGQTYSGSGRNEKWKNHLGF